MIVFVKSLASLLGGIEKACAEEAIPQPRQAVVPKMKELRNLMVLKQLKAKG
jgi:hypothetical protein